MHDRDLSLAGSLPGRAEFKLVVGLGNPGLTYAQTRHNVGFSVVDELRQRLGASRPKVAHRAELGEATLGDRKLLLAKPVTYMNASGEAVASLMRYYRFALSSLLVIYDDLDLPFGRIRLRPDGGAGGHNGVRSLIQSLGSDEFARLRVGIYRSGVHGGTSYVLGRWSSEEAEELPGIVALAADAAQCALEEGLERAMNVYNTRPEDRD